MKILVSATMWIGTIAPCAAAPCVAADPVSLRPRWIVGEELRYDLTAEYRQSTGDAADEARERRTSQAARLLLQVQEVSDSGSATIRLTLESLRVELSGPEIPAAETFDWPTPEAERGPEAAAPTPLRSLCSALVECTLIAEVGADGSVTGITGLLPLAKVLRESGGDSPALLGIGFFSPVRLKTNLASLWQVDPDGRGREAGARWRTRDDVTMGKGFDATATTEWTLVSSEAGSARVEGLIRLSRPASRREADPAAPKLSLKAESGSIAAEWDTSRGRLLSRTSDQSSTWTATVDLGPGAAVEQVSAESTAVSRITLKLVE